MMSLRLVISIMLIAVFSPSIAVDSKPAIPSLPPFRHCDFMASQFALDTDSSQARMFTRNESKTLRLVLANHGSDTHISVSPFQDKVEILASSETGQPLHRDEYSSTSWGSMAGGPTYFPAGATKPIEVPLDVLVPGLNTAGSYNVSAVLHIAFRDSRNVGCVESPPLRITVSQ